MRKAAKKQGASMNEILCTLTERYLRELQQVELYEAFGRLGDESEEASVEYALAAQAEVVLRDE